MEKPVVRISVRSLVEFILRNGDLDSKKGTMDKEAMLKGGRLHRKIQNQMGSQYRPEVSLRKETEYEDLVIVTEGRADGVLEENGQVIIDEIKGIYGNINNLSEPFLLHKAQAMCYAWFYAYAEQLSEIMVQMTYANLETEEIRRFHENFTYSELESWYQKIVDEYHKWVSYQSLWKKRRNSSMENLEFPFVYRVGQKKMVSAVYHSISREKQIFIQAPTGIGKTISTVFPAVRAVGESKGDTIFYLTAKNITRAVAGEAFGILQDRGLLFKVITITAKEKICILDKPECSPDTCPYAKGHFDRINDAVFELWTTEQKFDRDIIQSQADKWKVCPFEMSLDLAVWSDAVICDYNYAFDPNVHLKRFFGEGADGDYIFLIDEAHNLVERAREMYSASIDKEQVLQIKKLVKPYSSSLTRSLEKVNRHLLEIKKECETYIVLENAGALSLSLMQVMGEMDKLLEEPPEHLNVDEIMDFYFCVRDFLKISELIDENYVVFAENKSDRGFYLKLFCVNPAKNLETYLKKGRAAVFFSATLLPMIYHRKLLSVQTDDYGIYVKSPFSPQNRCLLIGTDVSTRYTRREYREYRKIAEYISKTVWQKKGNYMVFFPSYKLMQEVFAIYQEEYDVPWVTCVCQASSMTEKEREEFLEEFQDRQDTLIGFCVLGGVFSEGIDLLGKRLIGVIVAGTGLPQICSEREILKKYYDSRGENGFDYAYKYPGMNKVMQASGRVIRTQQDVGVILLLDERFGKKEYSDLFPVEWKDGKRCSLLNFEEMLRGFWDSVKDDDYRENISKSLDR